MNRTWVLLSLVVALPVANAQFPTPADRLLSHVPVDTGLVVVVPDFQKLVGGLVAFGKSIDVDALAEFEAREVLVELNLLGEVEGINVDGPFLLAHGPDQCIPLVLCTLSDADAWKQACDAEALEGGLLRIRICGESGFAAIEDDVLILASERETVQAALRADGKFAKRFQSQAGTLRAKHDIVLYVKVAPWRPMVEAALKAAAISIQMGVAMSAPQDKSAGQFCNWFFDELNQVVHEAQVWSAGLHVDDEVVFFESTLTFPPGGSIAKYLKQVRKCKADLLRGLPAEHSTIVLACEWETPPGTGSLTARMAQTLLDADTLKEKLGNEKCEKAMKAMTAVYDAMSGYNACLSLDPDDGGVLAAGLYFTTQPQTVLGNMTLVYEISSEFFSPLGTGSTVNVTPRREQIGSADIHAFDMVFKTEDEHVRRTLEAMYGKTTTVYMAPHSDGVVFAMGSTERARDQMTRMLNKQGDKLSDDGRVAAAAKALSPDPQACVLIDLPKLVKAGMGLALAAGGADLPPIDFSNEPTPFAALAGYLDPERVRIELRVPAEPVRVIIETVRSTRGFDDDY